MNDFGQNLSDDSDRDGDEPTFDGREHYENVEKSKLRQDEQPALGTQYKGAAVSRVALVQDSDDDPLAPVEEDEDSDPFARRKGSPSDADTSEGDKKSDSASQLASGHDSDEDAHWSEQENPSKISQTARTKKTTRLRHPENSFVGSNDEDIEMSDGSTGRSEMLSSESESDYSEMEEGDGILEQSDDGASDKSSVDESEPEQLLRTRNQDPFSDREKLKALLANDTAAVASTLSAAAAEDAKKGKAVRQQYRTFDHLLDARIKFQKGLLASNEIDRNVISDYEAKEAIHKAEEAALSLWSTIERLRTEIQSFVASEQPTKKRKSAPTPLATPSTPSTDLWHRTQSLESSSLSHRRAILNKWSSKTRIINSAATSSRSTHKDLQNQFTNMLDTYLATESDRLMAASNDNSDTVASYTDTTFYQSLLRDLIAQRSSMDPDAFDATNIPLKLHPPKTTAQKKAVDTRASKGRKIRYTVHEKLLNFAAPEDRGTWTEAARREFFASLLGGATLLSEGIDGQSNRDDWHVDGDAEVEALRLFRS